MGEASGGAIDSAVARGEVGTGEGRLLDFGRLGGSKLLWLT